MNITATPQIGPVIQRCRKERGLTLEQLADKSGVSKSMLSQVERGQANPTFAVLWSLTRALRIEFADLIEGGAIQGRDHPIIITSVTTTPEMKSADGLCRLRILSPARLAGGTEWYDVQLEPGGTLVSSAHAPGAFEHLTALVEKIEVTCDGASSVLEPGETARYPADVPHRITNISSRPARALLVNLYR